jgi:hypothetical protein
VVLLGYTNAFVQTHHWRNQAQYELAPGQVCGFRHDQTGDGEIELVLYSAAGTPDYARSLFRGLFEKFLNDSEVSIVRYPVARCPDCSEPQERAVVRKQVACGMRRIFCSYCGTQIELLERDDASKLSLGEEKKLTEERAVASRRTAYESALSWVKSNIRERFARTNPPDCFISYPWGVDEHEKWVVRLATDLRKAGIDVVLDRWHNTPGTSVTKFIERISSVDLVVAVGTPNYRKKYDSEDSDPVVDAELRLIGTRLRKRPAQRSRVIPVLLRGEQSSSFPPQLEDSVFLDFRLDTYYFAKLFDLVLTIYEIPFDCAGVDEIRDSLETQSL